MMICTRCDKHNADKGRLSRRDNKTSICRYCELEEQAVDHMVFSENTVPRKGMGCLETGCSISNFVRTYCCW